MARYNNNDDDDDGGTLYATMLVVEPWYMPVSRMTNFSKGLIRVGMDQL